MPESAAQLKRQNQKPRGGRGGVGVMDLTWTLQELDWTCTLAYWSCRPARTNYPSSPLCFHCSKCGTLPPESCFFSLICSTGSFMGEYQYRFSFFSQMNFYKPFIHFLFFFTSTHIYPTYFSWLNEALCTKILQGCFLSCSGSSQVSVPQNALPGPASPPLLVPLWRENLLYAMNGAFLGLACLTSIRPPSLLCSAVWQNYYQQFWVVYSAVIAQHAGWCVLIFFFLSIYFIKLFKDSENLYSRSCSHEKWQKILNKES